MIEHQNLVEMLADLEQCQHTFLELLDQVNDSKLYWRPDEKEWTMAENLVHVAEARQFFMGEVQKALTMEDATVGRTIADPGRVQNVAEHGSDSREVITQKLTDSYEQMIQTFKRMHDEDLQKNVQHVKYGSQTLGAFIEHFVVEHDQGHERQVMSLLA